MTSSINLIKQNYKEYFKNSIIQGSFLGFAIFSVYMLFIFLTHNENTLASQNLAPIILISSIVLGFLNIFFRELNQDLRSTYHVLNGITGVYWIMMLCVIISAISALIPFIFKLFINFRELNQDLRSTYHVLNGITGVYWIMMLCVIISAISALIPFIFKLFINSAVLTILDMWLLEYIYQKNISNSLNSSISAKKNKTIYIEMDKRIETMEEFFEEVNKYCSQFENVEYISMDLPALIRIDGVLYEAEIVEYYSVVGTAITAISIKTV